ncbi:MAG: helix-turn-helix domain-containing protein [Armatimonas sp.]
MQPQEFEAPEALRDAIKCFWYHQIHFGELPSNFEIVPDGYAEIIFHFGNPCSILYKGEWQPLPSPFIMGMLHQPVLIKAKGKLDILGIRCFPWTVFDLLGLPSDSDSVHILEHPIARLQAPLDRCIQANQTGDAVALVKAYFTEVQAQIATDTTLSEAGAAMRDANGTLPVSEVAAAAHATVRTLERKFKQSSGHTVKDVSGLMRFEQARNRLWLHPDSNLADLARELGYTDQSHLSREFKRYSGTTPAAFARKAREGKPR